MTFVAPALAERLLVLVIAFSSLFGYETLYAHCSSICVVAGQEVKQGEVIGYVGTTGNSTGNHLHFEVWQNGQRTDALSFFRAKE